VLLGVGGPLVAQQDPGVLLLAGDAEILGQKIRRLAHQQAADGVGEPDLDSRYRLEVPRSELEHARRPLETLLRPAQTQEQVGGLLVVQQRNAAHRLSAAGEHHAGLAHAHDAGRGGDGLHAGGAIAVDRVGDAVARQSRGQGDDTGDVGGVGRGGGVADDDLVDVLAPQAGTRQRTQRCHAAEILGGDAGQWPEGLGEGRPRPREDCNVKHEKFLPVVTSL
jgi:hypothetical protein